MYQYVVIYLSHSKEFVKGMFVFHRDLDQSEYKTLIATLFNECHIHVRFQSHIHVRYK